MRALVVLVISSSTMLQTIGHTLPDSTHHPSTEWSILHVHEDNEENAMQCDNISKKAKRDLSAETSRWS